MALTNLTTTNNVQPLYPGVGPNPTDAGGLLRLAQDGNRNAAIKVAGGEGGPDVVFTGNSAGAETVNFDIAFLSLFKLYAAQQADKTRLVVKAKISARAATVATSDYWELLTVIDDIGGTMTVVTSAGAVAFGVEGAATTDPVFSISSANLRCAVTTLGAAAIRVELYVNHVQ